MKKLIFGPLVSALRRTAKVVDAFLNPCPPPASVWDLPRAGGFHDKLFLS